MHGWCLTLQNQRIGIFVTIWTAFSVRNWSLKSWLFIQTYFSFFFAITSKSFAHDEKQQQRYRHVEVNGVSGQMIRISYRTHVEKTIIFYVRCYIRSWFWNVCICAGGLVTSGHTNYPDDSYSCHNEEQKDRSDWERAPDLVFTYKRGSWIRQRMVHVSNKHGPDEESNWLLGRRW